MTMNDRMIYVHIPFCDSKCFYCNFCSGIYSEELKKKYIEKLIEEIKINSNKNCEISSIYIGGGTPTSIDEKYIANILNTIKKYYKISKNAEISIEANPCSTTEKKLIKYLKHGVNRISFGVQSLDDKCLKIIGRKHNKKQAINAIKLAKKCGFKNISADVLIGIPKQNYFKLKNTIKKLIFLKINHISCYMLINEKGTKLTKLIEDKKLKTISDEKCVLYYNKVNKFLKKNKYYRYEISNFAKVNYECKHNIGYWQLKEYYGFGLSAHSFIDTKRYCNTCNLNSYLERDFKYNKEELSNSEIVEEMIMLGLRTKFGIDAKKLKDYGYDIFNVKKDELEYLCKNNVIVVKNENIVVSEDFYGVINQIILKLLP